MTRPTYTIIGTLVFLAFFALIAIPVAAQGPPSSSGDPRGGTGAATERSAPPPSIGAPSGGGPQAPAAPSTPSSGGGIRGGGGFGGDRAVPRRGAPEQRPGRVGIANPRSEGSFDTATTQANGGVPTYSRPRDGRPQTGAAIPRSEAPSPPRGTSFDSYYPWWYGYYPGGYYGSRWSPYYGYGAFGLGYFYYDPYWWYDPWGSSYSGYGAAQSYTSYDTGALRLKVKPRKAVVYVDGYFVGTVDEFDGVFQRLRLNAGPHRIEIRADGYESLTFDVRIISGETITYHGELSPIR